jgi:hypothetical protein
MASCQALLTVLWILTALSYGGSSTVTVLPATAGPLPTSGTLYGHLLFRMGPVDVGVCMLVPFDLGSLAPTSQRSRWAAF